MKSASTSSDITFVMEAIGSFSAALTEYSTCPVSASISSAARGAESPCADSAADSAHALPGRNITAAHSSAHTAESRNLLKRKKPPP